MKKILGGFFLIGGLILSQAQTISFEQTTIDYGTVPVGSDGHRVFTFKNTGDKPLILTNVQASCGCTTPEWERNPVLPGKTGIIKVGYNTNTAGQFRKNIDVYTNDPENGRLSLFIQGNVDPKVQTPVIVDQHAGHNHGKIEEIKAQSATEATPAVATAKPAEPKKGKAVRKKSKK